MKQLKITDFYGVKNGRVTKNYKRKGLGKGRSNQIALLHESISHEDHEGASQEVTFLGNFPREDSKTKQVQINNGILEPRKRKVDPPKAKVSSTHNLLSTYFQFLHKYGTNLQCRLCKTNIKGSVYHFYEHAAYFHRGRCATYTRSRKDIICLLCDREVEAEEKFFENHLRAQHRRGSEKLFLDYFLQYWSLNPVQPDGTTLYVKPDSELYLSIYRKYKKFVI